MDRLIADWSKGGYGSIDLKKPEGVIRFIWENFNSLCILTDDRNLSKIRRLDAFRKRYKVDFVAGCETQTNWFEVPDGHGFSELVGLGEDKRCITAHNVHDKTRCQPGGTLAAVYGRATAFGTVETGKDETGLGRFVWIVFRTEGLTRRIVSAYRPRKPSSIKRRGLDWKGTKVWEQHYNYFRKVGAYNTDPHYNFDKDLLALLSLWRLQGEEVMLMLDANDGDIYKSKFVKKLAEPGIQMEELFLKTNKTHAPYSHKEANEDSGVPLCGVFATQGFDCTSYFIF